MDTEEVLQVLASAARLTNDDGRIRWALDAGDVCGLLEAVGVSAEDSDRIFTLLGGGISGP
jgi:hypothetical protein